MKLRHVVTAWACSASLAGSAYADPQAEQDYYSLQIASAADARALEAAFARNAALPFVRIEQRGPMYVLRAGFWSDTKAARAALSGKATGAGLLRIATYKPDAIVRQNWGLANDTVSMKPQALREPLPPQVSPTRILQPDRALSAPVEPTGETLRPFDAQDYVLAFDAMVGAGDLRRAYELARKAVQTVPLDKAWRMRLAKISQWTQHPEVAAEQWLALFQQGDHSPETVAKVMELAPYADRPLMALQAWGIYAQQHSLSDTQWRDILNLYEAAAEPVLGADFFEKQYARTQNALLLEFAARLYENTGDDAKAATLYKARAALEPFSMDAVLRAVVIALRRDDLQDALALLQANEKRVPETAFEYWRLLGQVAWQLRDYATARQGYARYAPLPQASAADWSRLIFLVRQEHPAQAAVLALESYKRFKQTDALLLGLGLYAELGDTAAQERVFTLLGQDAEALAARETRFLLLRAQFYQRKKDPLAAWSDLRAAMRLAPEDQDVLMANLWFLIDARRTTDLQAFLKSKAALTETQTALWPGFAAASQVLERQRDAARWYGKIIQTGREDPLMLLNYADVRERLGNTGMADRLRRHAWMQLKAHNPGPMALRTLGESPELVSMARLSLLNQPGDPGLALVRELVHPLRGATDSPQTQEAQTLVLGWAILKDQLDNARAWMWRRYAQQSLTQAPLWGQAQVALKQEDTAAMDALLLRHSDALPVYNRYDMAYALSRQQEAFDVAFQGMTALDDQPLHDRYRQHVPLAANYVQIGAEWESGSELDAKRLHFETRLALAPKVFLIIQGSTQDQTPENATFSGLAGGQTQVRSVEIQWQGARATDRLALFQQESLPGGNGLRWNHSQTSRGDSRLSLNSALGYHTPSQISVPMRLAGYEDSVSTAVNYALGRREYIRVTPQYASYYTQSGAYLGNSQGLDLEAGHRIRLEYPDWRVRAYAKYLQFSRADTLDIATLDRLPADTRSAIANGSQNGVAYFIPAGSTRTGLCVDMGENLGGQNLQLTYSRAWRPFVNACISSDTVAGTGFNTTLGVAGSLTGEDHVRVQWDNTQGAEPGKGNANLLTLRYRHYF